VVDLRRDAAPAPARDDVRALDPDLVAAALRSPGRLHALLRDRAYAVLEVRTPGHLLSGRQALVLCALAATRTRRFITDGRAAGRLAFAAGAALCALRALGRELVGTVAMAAAVVVDERRRYRLPASAANPRSALYLRVEPSLRWQGAQVGGAATHTSGVVNGLIDAGVEVRTFAAEPLAGTERAAATPVTSRRMLDLIQGVGYADYARALTHAARPFRADFVYERYQLGSAAGLRVARRLGVPLVLEFNGPEVWVERHWRGGRMLLGGPLERLERRNLHDASLVVVVSRALRDIVVAQGVAPAGAGQPQRGRRRRTGPLSRGQP
jgi:hypothetical protein